MKRKLLITMLPMLIVFTIFSQLPTAFAHVSNEVEIYNDLVNSPAKEEITKMRALGIIPYIDGQESFEPTAELDKETLGSWLAKAANVAGHTESPTPEEFAEEAVEYNYIDNTEGIATYDDVVTGILKVIGFEEVTEAAEQAEELGMIEGEWHDLVDSGEIAIKENAVLLFDMALTTKGPNGSILDILSIQEGPTGNVTDVIEEVITVDGEEKEKYTIVMGEQQLPFYGEGKIALFTNILGAKGNEIVQSYVKEIEEEGEPAQEMLTYIQGDGSNAATPSVTEENNVEETKDVAKEETKATAEEDNESEENGETADEEESDTSLQVIWTVVISLLILIGIIFYVTGRKK